MNISPEPETLRPAPCLFVHALINNHAGLWANGATEVGTSNLPDMTSMTFIMQPQLCPTCKVQDIWSVELVARGCPPLFASAALPKVWYAVRERMRCSNQLHSPVTQFTKVFPQEGKFLSTGDLLRHLPVSIKSMQSQSCTSTKDERGLWFAAASCKVSRSTRRKPCEKIQKGQDRGLVDGS